MLELQGLSKVCVAVISTILFPGSSSHLTKPCSGRAVKAASCVRGGGDGCLLIGDAFIKIVYLGSRFPLPLQDGYTGGTYGCSGHSPSPNSNTSLGPRHQPHCRPRYLHCQVRLSWGPCRGPHAWAAPIILASMVGSHGNTKRVLPE